MPQNGAELFSQDGGVVADLFLAGEQPHLRDCHAPPRRHSQAEVTSSNAFRRVDLRVLTADRVGLDEIHANGCTTMAAANARNSRRRQR